MRVALIIALILAMSASACDFGPSGPVAGELTLSLTTPRLDDGGVLFIVRGTSTTTIADVQATCAGCQVFWRMVSANEARVALTGPVVAGPVATISVSDARRADAYVATIQDVSTRTFVIVPLDGYQLTVE